MSFPSQGARANKLLALLPSSDYCAIAREITYVELPRGVMLAKTGRPIEYVYFLTNGIGSVIVATAEGNRAEAGIFGFDGYIPTSAIAGMETSPYDVLIQVAAKGYEMPYENFRRWMDSNRNFSRIMIRSIEAFSIQLAYTAVSNAIHEVTQRLARWLLMCDDRIMGNEIELTHEFLSIMLAVRRPTVTTSLHVLEGQGLIRSERGNIIIRNRSGLEQYAHDAYGRPETEYFRLMQGFS
ncbi:Crp/Fnr family transcriptional regulator [Falsochrobactrum shanghaiense]|uniref:Crp/Fnr family transcriptional regulator n=1 Tax=Falsochrobactrum shanghaiense TaxID=2201899 RepID=A0A316J6R6_9HYPH|nr:Crp/Fnr family transcriptional regulator [Falsochrobactrum shanghaiense]PWL16459.1 Crp/Fnr family transcriptional regulator [Falsochrobactrum shanghaiense]